MTNLTIRNADEGDIAFILELEASPNGKFVHGDSRDEHLAQLIDPDFIYLIGEWDGNTIGYAILVQHAENTVEWRRIMVAKADGGIGSYFMKQTISHMFEDGIETIKLDVYSDNKRARHVYGKLGFTETHKAPCPRETHRILVFMELSA